MSSSVAFFTVLSDYWHVMYSALHLLIQLLVLLLVLVVVESRSGHDQNTSWVIIGYPRWKNFTQCSFYVFFRRRFLHEDQETMSIEQDNEKEKEQLDSLEGLREQATREL